MDDNTLKFLLALIGVIQIVMLGYFTYRQNVAATKLRVVHDLVNGLAHENADHATAAATAQGELAGRDFEVAKRQQQDTIAETKKPTPVTIVGTETVVPVHVEDTTTTK